MTVHLSYAPVVEGFKGSPVGAKLSITLAENLTCSFSVVKDRKRMVERKANPNKAIELINQALKQQEKDAPALTNITYHAAVRTKADILATLGQKAKAKEEPKDLVKYLKSRGVKKPVLDEIETHAKLL